MQQTHFTDEPPDADLLSALAVLRRPQGRGDVCPYTAPDWLPFLASVSVPYYRRLAADAVGTWHLLVGDAGSESAVSGSVAVVMHEQDDQLSLAWGPAGARQIKSARLPAGAGGGCAVQLVPDGVVAAALAFRGGDRVVVPVHDNLWAYEYGEGPGAADPFPTQVDWLDGSGGVLRTLSE